MRLTRVENSDTKRVSLFWHILYTVGVEQYSFHSSRAFGKLPNQNMCTNKHIINVT